MPAKAHTSALRPARRLLVAVTAISLIWTVPAASAQQIALKRPFFAGWRYSIDGGDYRKLGAGTELKSVMSDNRACLAAMNSFSDHATAAKITGVLAILLISWPVSTQLRGQDWLEGYTPMVIVGGTFGAVSLAMEAAGSRNLKRAVMIHNRIHGYAGSELESTSLPPPEFLEPGIRLTFRF